MAVMFGRSLAVLGLCVFGFGAKADILHAPAPQPPLGTEMVLLGDGGMDLSRLPGFPELQLRKMATDRFWRGDLDRTKYVIIQPRPFAMPGSGVADRRILDEHALPSEAKRDPQLKEVLLGLINLRRNTPTAAARTAGDADPADLSLGFFDLRRFVLDNEALGSVVQALVKPLPIDEDDLRTFTILGFGRWAVETDRERIALTELTAATSLEVKPITPAPEPVRLQEASTEAKREKIDIIATVVQFVIDSLTSAMGMFTIIAAFWLAAFFFVARFIGSARARRF
jgi:hypothetical protein